MKEYIVVKGTSIKHLMDQVNLFLKDGYQVTGGIAIEHDFNENRAPRIKCNYYQAMVR